MSLIPDNIKRLAKADGFPDVKYLCVWRDTDVYTAFDPEAPYVGQPQYVLADGTECRWATPEETEELMSVKP